MLKQGTASLARRRPLNPGRRLCTFTYYLATPREGSFAMAVNAELLQTLRRGIDCCRRGDWNEGLRCLGQVAERGDTGLPGVFYSYLGYGIALREQGGRGKALHRSSEATAYGAPPGEAPAGVARRSTKTMPRLSTPLFRHSSMKWATFS